MKLFVECWCTYIVHRTYINKIWKGSDWIGRWKKGKSLTLFLSVHCCRLCCWWWGGRGCWRWWWTIFPTLIKFSLWFEHNWISHLSIHQGTFSDPNLFLLHWKWLEATTIKLCKISHENNHIYNIQYTLCMYLLHKTHTHEKSFKSVSSLNHFNVFVRNNVSLHLNAFNFWNVYIIFFSNIHKMIPITDYNQTWTNFDILKQYLFGVVFVNMPKT